METKNTLCPICKQNRYEHWAVAYDVEYFTCEKAYEYLRCLSCGCMYLKEPPVGRLKDIYPINYYSYSNNSFSVVKGVKNILDGIRYKGILHKINKDNIRVLDVGGGSGWCINEIKRIDDRVMYSQIVDIDPGAEKAARDGGHDFFLGRVEDFKTNGKFDLILLLNLIEHVEDPKLVLAKTRELLNPNGFVLIKTPNFDSLDARLFRNSSWAGFHCPRHWVLFTKQSFYNLCGQVGLSVESFSYTQGAPFWAASILAVLGRLGIVTISANLPSTKHYLFSPLVALFAIFDILRMPFFKTSQMFFVLKDESSS
ncbi:hypothetical protein [Methylomonas albis]|uniref:Class I SAM-dependent methyltransferase n=1 Tax=Methylomonas albis TaxID=1854563 RepID=A0ABR9D122_9GAMM|nr:class I SAM-dependent methyltransferase [Methylomonas albis]MBD9356715.1 class I SAM-dependent methyltransferase [Methylomonas albis]CAD6879860.1 hypothetical protein [Methylomonas albis]